jgi:hypothetical protein
MKQLFIVKPFYFNINYNFHKKNLRSQITSFKFVVK